MSTTRRRRLFGLAAVVLAALAILLAGPGGPSAAAPNDPSATDEEGGSATLRANLEAASKGYLDAKAALEHSRAEQVRLSQELQTTEAEFAALASKATTIAQAAYRNGPLSTTSALLSSNSPGSFVERTTVLNIVAARNDRQLRELARVRAKLAETRASLDAAIKTQEQQLAEMAKRRQDAERALATVGGQPTAGPAPSTRTTATATPAPRRSNGTWPPESCSRDDPTTSGCITPRTLHALQQARAAGFNHYVSCYRSGGSGEHPKGRACDFAAAQNGFGGIATGADRTYGDNLAAYFIRNADRLAVLYVIWFAKIWLPSSGWRSYSGCCDAAATHKNHVHLSVY